MTVVERIFDKHHPNNLNITMNHISKEANIAKGTLYLYFATKEELIFKTYIKSLNIKHEELKAELDKSNSSFEKYKTFFDFYYDFFVKYPYYLSIQMYCENGGFERTKLDENILLEYRQIARKTRKMMNLILQDCINEGFFRADLNVEITTFNYSRALRGVIFFCLFTFPQHYLNLNKVCTARDFYNNFIQILLAGMKS